MDVNDFPDGIGGWTLTTTVEGVRYKHSSDEMDIAVEQDIRSDGLRVIFLTGNVAIKSNEVEEVAESIEEAAFIVEEWMKMPPA